MMCRFKVSRTYNTKTKYFNEVKSNMTKILVNAIKLRYYYNYTYVMHRPGH